MRGLIVIAFLVACSGSAWAGVVPVVYDAEFKAFKKDVVSGDVLSFEFYGDAGCTVPIQTTAVTAGDPTVLFEKVIAQKAKQGPKVEKIMRLRTVVNVSSSSGARFLRVTGAGIVGTPSECQVQGATPAPTSAYSAFFENGETPTTQCTAFDTFRAGLTAPSYVSVQLGGGSAPPATCADPVEATALLDALRTGGSLSASCGGTTWRVGPCGDGMEISAGTTSLCNCNAGVHVLRPCIGNSNWGGVGTASCSAPSQTLSVTVD